MPQATRRCKTNRPAADRAVGLWLFCALIVSPGTVLAQDLSNPFGEPETSRPLPRKSQTPLEPKAPLLAPMNGDARSPSPDPGGPGVPYSAGLDGTEAHDANRPDLRQDLNQGPQRNPQSGWLKQAPAASTYLPDSGVEGAPVAPIERVDLDPVAASDGSGLPHEMWSGLTVETIEEALAKLEIPPRSAALHGLWRRLITSSVAPPSGSTGAIAGTSGTPRFSALRAEVLYRSGLLNEAHEVLAHEPGAAADPMLATLNTRLEIGQGRREQACGDTSKITTIATSLPPALKMEAVLMSGYCAALRGDLQAAGLNAGLAREIAPNDEAGADALETLSAGAVPVVPKGAKLSLIDYRIFELGKADFSSGAFANASPALLAVLALDPSAPMPVRLEAGEAAAGINAITPEDLATIYRAATMPAEPSAADRRAEMFRAAEKEQTPAKKTRAIRALLDEARRSAVYLPALIMLDKPVEDIKPVPEIGWFTETAIEISLAAGRYDRARTWAASMDGATEANGLAHWLALADLADPALTSGRSAHLDRVEELAGNGRIDANVLHRLVTVLDALEIQVPISLWDKASRTAQPNTGYLPETGVLSQLQEAAKKKEFGHTVLLVMRALGPAGADSAHLIALGDSIRALRKAGLEGDARRLGFEALFASWPRAITN